MKTSAEPSSASVVTALPQSLSAKAAERTTAVVDRVAPSGLLTTKEAAAYLNVAPATLEVWRSTNRQRLTWVRIGGLPRYRRSDIDAFIEANTVVVS